MQQTPEASAFLTRIAALPKGPGVSLDKALQPSLDDEAELRQLFATDKTNARLKDPHVGLVDVFEAPVDVRTTRARVVKDADDLSAKYVMPLSDINRRAEGTPSMVSDLEEFKKNWSIFTEGSLSQLVDWSNVVAAGGAVLACMTPLSDAAKVSKRAIRKYYHNTAYPTSDVDLFLWGLTAEQAEVKINTIFEAVRDSVPWDVTCVRTKHTVSIHSQYPYRSVQIVLRLYTSPAEILAGFDIDAPCCAYDGQRVWANPRAIVAIMCQCNTVDMTRRSPSYEVRLAKYSSRAFEVHVPSLRRSDIDPTIFERSIARIEGLARLLVLEKLTNTDIRYAFLESRRTLRGRPNPLSRYQRKKKFKGDLKADMAIGGLEMNDYDVVSLHIPYGPGWDARRIDKLVYQTDLGMNSTFNPKNKGRRLHRHPAFFGTMLECLNDCCEHCPQPKDEDEKKLQEEEDKQYIRGRISFIAEDPGRQSITGSFNPIDVGEWSEQVYIGINDRFFAAIASHNRAEVLKMIEEGIDVNRRDCVGRAPLHCAILCGTVEIACDLVDAGARMTARLVDGRSCLHLAAQMDQVVVMKKLFERSAVNAEQAEVEEKPEEGGDNMDVDVDVPQPTSEDEDENGDGDGDSENDEEGSEGDSTESAKPNAAEPQSGDIPEDASDEPDVLDINLPDWDLGFSPLGYAVLFASLPMIEVLLAEGADAKFLSQSNSGTTSLQPLTLTILRENEDEAVKIAERLLLAGVSSSTAYNELRTIFHSAVLAGKTKLVSTLLRSDPNAAAVLNFPATHGWNLIVFPIVSAINKGDYSMVATLLAHGVKVVLTGDDLSKSQAIAHEHRYEFSGMMSLQNTFLPVETGLTRHDDIVRLLIAVGADFNLGIQYANISGGEQFRRSLLDWVEFAIATLTRNINLNLIAASSPQDATPGTGWKHDIDLYSVLMYQRTKKKESDGEKNLRRMKDVKKYLVDMERVLRSHGAKTWNDIYTDPDLRSTATPEAPALTPTVTSLALKHPEANASSYGYFTKQYYTNPVPSQLTAAYDKLYKACFIGSNEKIEQLCLPPKGSEIESPLLNISVQMTYPGHRYLMTGYTPLFAAICGRRWDTAKLILLIAEAQYAPGTKEAKFSTRDINLDVGSDSESDDDDDDMHSEKEINFIDIAKRPSAVQNDVHPRKMLESTVNWWSAADDREYSGILLVKAVRDNDFEAFINIANLYKALTSNLEIDRSVLQAILDKNQPEMLDEYIRMTGRGIDFVRPKPDGQDEEPINANEKKRLYLGLSVHGKKRMDLVKKNDPNANQRDQVVEHPLLWRACLAGADAIVDYLSGDRPLAAYRFHLSSNSTDRAERLRRIPDLDKALPGLLGWTTTSLGESPLTAAILGGKLRLIKKLFEKSPRLLASWLHERIKFMGLNPLMLAVQIGCEPSVIDYLLAKSVSPAECDLERRWNIYHIACAKNHCDLIAHLLEKLPRDVSETLLSQQSKTQLNTPLHLAVKVGGTQAVALIVEFSKSTLLARDVSGSTPLHCAVRKGYPEITKLLVDAAPAEALFMENGVGLTPLEISSLHEFRERTSAYLDSLRDGPKWLELSEPSVDPPPYNMKALETELPRLRLTIEGLFLGGKLKKGTKLADELLAFTDLMESKLTEAREDEAANHKAVEQPVEDRNPTEVSDFSQTLEQIRHGIARHSHIKRHLVHLIDVQRSVQGDLAKSNQPVEEPSWNGSRNRNLEEGLEPEEDTEDEGRKTSMVFAHIRDWRADGF